MHLEKVVRVLKAFNERQLDRLEDYLDSPYFKITPGVSLLFKRLKPLYPKFSESKMDYRVLGQKDKRLSTSIKQSTLGSHLLKAIEQFLAQEQWQKNEDERMRLTINGWRDLGLMVEYEKAFDKQMEKIEADAEWTTDLFWERHKITEAKYNNFNAKLKRSPPPDLMPIINTLDEFHAIKKIRILCELLNRHQFFGAPFNFSAQELDTVFKVLEPFCNDRYPYVYVFVNVFKMMEESTYKESDLYYRFLKQFVEKHGKSETIEEASNYAFNYCLRWYNKGYQDAAEEYLWWIEWKAKNNLLYYDDKITPVTFRNIIGAALYVRSPEWIEKAIHCYSPHLPEEHRETQTAFTKGLHQYALKDYKKAIRYFLSAEAKEELIFNGIIREWQAICLYEDDKYDTDTFFNHLASFEKFVQRNRQNLKQSANAFELFISYSFKLAKYVQLIEVNACILELQQENHFIGKPWLLRQFGAKQKLPIHNMHR